jgi:hypothetical protein
MKVRSRASAKQYKKWIAEDSQPKMVHIEFLGFGKRIVAKNLRLVIDDIEFVVRKKRRPYFAIAAFAINELNVQNPDPSIAIPTYPFFVLAKRILSLLLQTKRLLPGVFNGYRFSISLPQDSFGSTCSLQTSAGDLVILRTAARIGLISYDLESTFEQNFRRGISQDAFQITHANSYPLFATQKQNRWSKRFFRREIDNQINESNIENIRILMEFLPKWDYARAQADLLLDLDRFTDSNFKFIKGSLVKIGARYYFEPKELEIDATWENEGTKSEMFTGFSIRNARVSSDGIVSAGDYVVPLSTRDFQSDSGAFWPQNLWSMKDSSFVIRANSKDTESDLTNAIYLRSQSNWAHFIEDYLPGAILLSHSFESSQVLISSNTDALQEELLRVFFEPERIHKVGNRESLRVGNLRLFIHNFNRDEVISGEISGREMIDTTLMLDLRNSILDLVRNRNSRYNQIFICRPRTSLRRLINQKRVRKVLVDSGFVIVYPEKMTLFERIEVFSNARIVIAESGAGTANLYFCSANTKIVELKHPQMIRSREYEAIENVTGNQFQIVYGRSPNIWQKIRFGRDSFSISIEYLSKVIAI